jgi:hypothetical protein
LSRENDVLIIEEEESDAKGASEIKLANDGKISEWAQVLEPVRKLPTIVGTRIRKCVNASGIQHKMREMVMFFLTKRVKSYLENKDQV